MANTIQELQKQVADFCEERDWRQFHTAKDTAMAIAVESGELLELFLWNPDSAEFVREHKDKVADELADVFYNILMFAHEQNIDLVAAFESKLKKIGEKYPVEKSKGNRKKYTEL